MLMIMLSTTRLEKVNSVADKVAFVMKATRSRH